MFFMGNGFMNSDWGMMGGYPSATGYRFEAHKTGLENRIAIGDSLPLGADLDPSNPDYERHLDATATVKRDKQCITTEDCYANHDLYLNYLRGGPGFGDPIDREPKAIEADLNQKFLLPEYAAKVYGAVFTQDAKGVFTVDPVLTAKRRGEIRKERLARALPTREWMKEERERIVNKHAAVQVQHMFATSFALSEKFTREFKDFWNLPADWQLLEEDLGVPSYGSKHRMDLSLLPDVTTVVQVEE
jgi:acetone carboxylase alpha subunit